MLHFKDLLNHRRLPRDLETDSSLYSGIFRCINVIPVINTFGLSIQKQSFSVQPNLLMYKLFKMFNSHLLLESQEYDDTVTKLQKLRVKLKPETPGEPLRYLGPMTGARQSNDGPITRTVLSSLIA